MPWRVSKEAVGEEWGTLRRTLHVLRVPFAWVVSLASLIAAALIFGGLAWVAWWAMPKLAWLHRGWLERFQWDDYLAGGLGVSLVLVTGWFAFPLVVTAAAGLFLEPLADRIERMHYPELPAARNMSIREQTVASLRTLARTLGWNLLGFPFYFIPFVNVVAYAVINGFLLSREYFQIVALRHMPLPEAKALYRRHRFSMWRGGLVLTGIFLIPVVNMVAPLLATAWMVHRVWQDERSPLRAAWLKKRSLLPAAAGKDAGTEVAGPAEPTPAGPETAEIQGRTPAAATTPFRGSRHHGPRAAAAESDEAGHE